MSSIKVECFTGKKCLPQPSRNRFWCTITQRTMVRMTREISRNGPTAIVERPHSQQICRRNATIHVVEEFPWSQHFVVDMEIIKGSFQVLTDGKPTT